jgi:hypothetical protein
VIKPEIDVTKPKDPNASVRAKVHRIAKEIGVEIVTHGPHDPYKEVYPPPWLHEGNDPYDGEHMVYDWQEALVMVEEYKKIVEQR